MTQAHATAQGLSLFDWLTTLYPIWGQMDAESVYASAKVGLVELILSGATTVADHLYLFPNDSKLDDDNNQQVDKTIDAGGTVVIPGLINCHHHLYQTLTRSIGTAQGLSLFDWLTTLYPIWGQMDAESVYASAKVGLVELILSGATTVADHLYLFPNDSKLDDEIRAAQELGVRFHPTRGSMSLGQSQGGLPPR